jgi:hypothetical protein
MISGQWSVVSIPVVSEKAIIRIAVGPFPRLILRLFCDKLFGIFHDRSKVVYTLLILYFGNEI